MTDAEIIAELRAIRYARPTLMTLARDAGVSHTALYEVVKTGIITSRVKEAAERALVALRNERGNNRRSAAS